MRRDRWAGLGSDLIVVTAGTFIAGLLLVCAWLVGPEITPWLESHGVGSDFGSGEQP